MSKKIISFEASSELKEQLRIMAFNQNTTISALIRKLLGAAVLGIPADKSND